MGHYISEIEDREQEKLDKEDEARIALKANMDIVKELRAMRVAYNNFDPDNLALTKRQRYHISEIDNILRGLGF